MIIDYIRLKSYAVFVNFLISLLIHNSKFFDFTTDDIDLKSTKNTIDLFIYP